MEISANSLKTVFGFYRIESYPKSWGSANRSVRTKPRLAEAVFRTLEGLAQNGRGVKRTARNAREFLCCWAARGRALCALLEQSHFHIHVRPRVRRRLYVLGGQMTESDRFVDADGVL